MDKYLDWLSGSSFGVGSVGLAVAAALVLALWVLMPRAERKKARLPTYLLAALVAVRVLHGLALSPGALRVLDVAGTALLLAGSGRAAFLLLVDWFFAHRLKSPLSKIFADIVQVVIYAVVVLATFREMGAELGSLLTTSALLTAVVGLSLQETLGNLFAGLAIQAQRPFRVGDWIQIEGTPDKSIGMVTEINWRATKLLTVDGIEIVVPNALLAKSPLRNYSQPIPASRRGIRVQAPYAMPPHRVETALLEALKGCPGVLEDPGPMTLVSEFADSGIEYALFYSIDEFSRRGAIDSAVRRRVWYAFQRAGIDIPFPVRQVRVEQVSEARARETEEERVRERVRWLRAVDFLDVLPQEALEHLARDSKACSYGPGEDVIRQGDEGTDLFVMKSGEAAVLVTQGDREAVEVARLGPGSVFGEMSLVTGERRSATVRALGPSELIVVAHSPFRYVLAQNPDLAQRISEVLASRQAAIEQANSAVEVHDRATQSGLLLSRIKNFFSLWPRGDTGKEES
jgi:small-conductance mechanosensitive channel/CRP-like cAMP-binding protein